jgi:Fe-Mn family superoxide dismutase
MALKLPELPYAIDALQPHMSKETLTFHHGKHHNAYVTKLNALTEGSPKAELSLEQLIKSEEGPIFNNAAQVWNHTFFWHCMRPGGGGAPTGRAAEVINKAFGSFDNFKKEFSTAALNQFGSGWAWLIKDGDGVKIVTTSNAGTPIKEGKTPVLTCDVWEHAYYIDYRNDRGKFVEAFWNLVNWDFVNKNLG